MFGLDDLAAASLVSTGVNALGSVIGGISNNRQQEKLLQFQNDYSERMWNESNEYNKPINEYRRYVEAGLNPAYFMGNGAGLSSPIASSSAPTPAGDMQSPFSGLADSISRGLGLELQKKQLDLTESKLNQDILESDARIKKLAQETASIEIENSWKDIISQKTVENLDATFKKLVSDVALNDSHISLNKAQKGYTQSLRKTEDMIRDEKLRNLVSDTMYKNSQVRLTNEQIKQVILASRVLAVDAQEREANIDLDGTSLTLKRLQNGLLGIDYKVHNTEEWQAAAKRMGMSDDELTEKYVNGITSTLMNIVLTAGALYFMKGKAPKLPGTGFTPGASSSTSYGPPTNI